MRTVTAKITWPDGKSIRGIAHYRAPEQGSFVTWDGDAEIVAKLPPDIGSGQRCSLDYLRTDAKNFAKREGATFEWHASGFYEMTL